jgi:cytochrome c peroxidase
MRRLFLFLSIIPISAGCNREEGRAGQYPPRHIFADKPLTKLPPSEAEKPRTYWAWREPKPIADVPIVFVASSSPEWQNLQGFWTMTPTAGGVPALVASVSPLVPAPFSAAVALHMVSGWQINVKVPRGLPDPAPFIPAANPPSYARWQLGKELFFEKMLYPDTDVQPLSCASCHEPKKNFGDERRDSLFLEYSKVRIRTPNLLNVIYNRHQFWDGRVTALEQVVTRDIADETLPVTRERFGRHIFGGLPKYLEESPYYKSRFLEVFGRLPTQDMIGKALATYLRTILSGNARVDEASLPDALEKGRRLFMGKANCAACHHVKNGLYTDNDFHNVGLPGFFQDALPEGRLVQVPAGLKETRLTGAYRTPGLRNVTKSKFFMHNGVFGEKVEHVIEHFKQVHSNPYLASALKDPSGNVRKLDLSNDEVESLAAFLHALEGGPVDARVSDPPKKLP